MAVQQTRATQCYPIRMYACGRCRGERGYGRWGAVAGQLLTIACVCYSSGAARARRPPTLASTSDRRPPPMADSYPPTEIDNDSYPPTEIGDDSSLPPTPETCPFAAEGGAYADTRVDPAPPPAVGSAPEGDAYAGTLVDPAPPPPTAGSASEGDAHAETLVEPTPLLPIADELGVIVLDSYAEAEEPAAGSAAEGDAHAATLAVPAPPPAAERLDAIVFDSPAEDDWGPDVDAAFTNGPHDRYAEGSTPAIALPTAEDADAGERGRSLGADRPTRMSDAEEGQQAWLRRARPRMSISFAANDAPDPRSAEGYMALLNPEGFAMSRLVRRATGGGPRGLPPLAFEQALRLGVSQFMNGCLPPVGSPVLEHVVRTMERRMAAEPMLHIYIGITEAPARRWVMHTETLRRARGITIVHEARTSDETAAIERAAIRAATQRWGPRCLNVGTGGEGASRGSPHYCYVLWCDGGVR